MSEAKNNFDRAATKQEIDTARESWKGELKHVFGGLGHVAYSAAGIVKTIDDAAALITIPFDAIGVGVPAQIAEGAVHALASTAQGALQTAAENHAIEKAGGTEADKGGLGRTAANSLKHAIPLNIA